MNLFNIIIYFVFAYRNFKMFIICPAKKKCYELKSLYPLNDDRNNIASKRNYALAYTMYQIKMLFGAWKLT